VRRVNLFLTVLFHFFYRVFVAANAIEVDRFDVDGAPSASQLDFLITTPVGYKYNEMVCTICMFFRCFLIGADFQFFRNIIQRNCFVLLK